MADLSPRKTETDDEPEGVERLDSWKEIATYLCRDVRTVQRWEKSEGLPVRRHLHDTLGSIYAYRHELDAWREGRQPLANSQEPPVAQRSRAHRRWVVVGGLVVLVGASLIVTRSSWIGHGTAPVVLRIVQLTRDRLPKFPRLATDGSRVYFSERVSERWVVTAISTTGGAPETVPIPLSYPVVEDVSPDGSEMLVTDRSSAVNGSPALYRVPAGGGALRRVGEVATDSAIWLRDGRTILYRNGFQLEMVDRDGAAPRTLVTAAGIPTYASASPDGRLVRYSVVDTRNMTCSVWEVGIDGGVPRPLFPGWRAGAGDAHGSWSADGDYFIVATRDGSDGVWVERGGKRWFGREAAPERLTILPLSAYAPVASREGQRLFLMAEFSSGHLVRWDPGAREFVAHPAGIPGTMVDYSPDGAWIVYVAFPSYTLWRARADGTERRPLTDPSLRAVLPRWSPDGERIAFSGSTHGRPWRIYAVPSKGGRPQPLAEGRGAEADPGWSPDGRSLVFSRDLGEKPYTGFSLRLLDLATGQTTELPGSEGKSSPRWSPDGRHIAARPADSQKLLVLDLETRQWSEPVTGDVDFPTWSRDGTHLYFQAHEKNDLVIHRLRLRDGRTERVASRKTGPDVAAVPGPWFGLDPEGRLLVMRGTTVTEVFGFDYAWP